MTAFRLVVDFIGLLAIGVLLAVAVGLCLSRYVLTHCAMCGSRGPLARCYDCGLLLCRRCKPEGLHLCSRCWNTADGEEADRIDGG